MRDDRFYIDCEFDGHGGPLISIAVVSENGRSLHLRAIDTAATDPWVIENVVPLLDSHEADQDISCFRSNMGAVLRRFIGGSENPTIIADSPVDIGRFCAAISTDPDGGWASADCPRMTFEVHNVDCYPTDLPGAVQHNAYWDAMALRHKLSVPMTFHRCNECRTIYYGRILRFAQDRATRPTGQAASRLEQSRVSTFAGRIRWAAP